MDHESAINYYYIIIISSFSADVEHRHPVTVRRTSLMTESTRPV